MNTKQRSEVIQMLALADSRGFTHIVDILTKYLSNDKINNNSISTEGWEKYNDSELDNYLELGNKINWIKTFRHKILENYNFSPGLVECKNICDSRLKEYE